MTDPTAPSPAPAAPSGDQTRTVDSATDPTGGIPWSSVDPTTRSFYPFLGPPKAPDDLGTLGPYRVTRLLGEGGMGFVFRGEDDQLRRPVALKVMRPEVAAKPHAPERFLRGGGRPPPSRAITSPTSTSSARPTACLSWRWSFWTGRRWRPG